MFVLSLKRKSVKEIAFILERSPRTIEDHGNLLKYKFNCVTKSQLIDKAFQLVLGKLFLLPYCLFNEDVSIALRQYPYRSHK